MVVPGNPSPLNSRPSAPLAIGLGLLSFTFTTSCDHAQNVDLNTSQLPQSPSTAFEFPITAEIDIGPDSYSARLAFALETVQTALDVTDKTLIDLEKRSEINNSTNLSVQREVESLLFAISHSTDLVEFILTGRSSRANFIEIKDEVSEAKQIATRALIEITNVLSDESTPDAEIKLPLELIPRKDIEAQFGTVHDLVQKAFTTLTGKQLPNYEPGKSYIDGIAVGRHGYLYDFNRIACQLGYILSGMNRPATEQSSLVNGACGYLWCMALCNAVENEELRNLLLENARNMTDSHLVDNCNNSNPEANRPALHAAAAIDTLGLIGAVNLLSGTNRFPEAVSKRAEEIAQEYRSACGKVKWSERPSEETIELVDRLSGISFSLVARSLPITDKSK